MKMHIYENACLNMNIQKTATTAPYRHQKTITDTFKEGFKGATLVHDCRASHFNTPAMTHQLCIRRFEFYR